MKLVLRNKFVMLLFFCMVYQSAIHATSITTVDIIQRTAQALPNCTKYKITGMCFWLQCDGLRCWVKPTLKVSHYTPDAVVSVYDEKNDNPWLEARVAYDAVGYAAGNRIMRTATKASLTGGEQIYTSPQEGELRVKEATVVGHPLSRLFSGGTFIRSKATPFAPYFQSMANAFSWRMGIEALLPQSIAVPLYTLGQFPLSVWGTVYPREGFVDNANDAKSAAVIAFRAAHIITRRGQPHVYNPLSSGRCGEKCEVWNVSHNDEHHHWQMLYPISENQCHPIAYHDAGQVKEWGLEEAQQSEGAYA